MLPGRDYTAFLGLGVCVFLESAWVFVRITDSWDDTDFTDSFCDNFDEFRLLLPYFSFVSPFLKVLPGEGYRRFFGPGIRVFLEVTW